MKKQAKKTNYALGLEAEDEAARYLEGQGFCLLHRRYKTKYGEIDLIVQKGDLLCFVEVKVRSNVEKALHSVTLRAQKRIENAALFFLSAYPDYAGYDMRFDVVVLSERFQVTHLDNAWEARS